MRCAAGLRSIVVVVGVLLAVGACSSDDEAEPAAAKPPVPAAPVAEAPVEDSFFDGSEPTPEAYAERDRVREELVEGDDCGNVAADSGWPTTIMQGPDSGDCLIAALRAGETATQTYTGRTGDGAALLTTYVVRPDGSVAVTLHEISADGEATVTDERTCTPPATEWLLGLDGTVVDFRGGGGAHC